MTEAYDSTPLQTVQRVIAVAVKHNDSRSLGKLLDRKNFLKLSREDQKKLLKMWEAK